MENWENAEKIFPSGTTPDKQLTIEQLKQINPPYYTFPFETLARNMVISKKKYVWGNQGEFALIEDYNLQNLLPHPEIDSALNVYGQHMIVDYLYLKHLTLDEIKEHIVNIGDTDDRFNYTGI